MSRLVANYNGGASDEYGTFAALNRLLTGDVIEGFQVVPNGTPNMTVKVNPGSGRITTGVYPSSYGYFISHDTTGGESVTIPTAAASPRIDYIVAYIDKSVTAVTSPVNNTNNVLKFADVSGTPAGSPVVPTVSQIQTAIGAANPYIILAQIAVAASATTITTPNITDLRNFVTTGNDAALGTNSYVDSGLAWTGSTLAGAMTAGRIYINVGGVMVSVSVASIGSHSFTASKDTYVSVDVNGVVSYSEVANNATSPTLPTNSIWLAIVVTGASAITSINAGQTSAVAPVVSSTVIAVCDTNGKLIYPSANQKLIGYRQITSVYNGTAAEADVTGLSCAVTLPNSRDVKVTFFASQIYSSVDADRDDVKIQEDGVEVGGIFNRTWTAANGGNGGVSVVAHRTPAVGTHTYKARIGRGSGTGTPFIFAAATTPSFIAVEIE